MSRSPGRGAGTAVPTDLAAELEKLGRIGVLVSGGADSEALLRAAAEVCGRENVLALTASSILLAEFHMTTIRRVARQLGVELEIVSWNPLDVDAIRRNGPDRCYHCKKTIIGLLGERARERGFEVIADGTTVDDLSRDRPGLRAAGEAGIAHPFVDAGMSDAEVREMASGLGMADPGRPSDSCLATRIDPGTPLSVHELKLAEELEEPFKALVKGRFRVYLHPSGAVVHYRSCDATVVNRLRKGLRDAAEEAGLKTIRFILEDD